MRSGIRHDYRPEGPAREPVPGRKRPVAVVATVIAAVTLVALGIQGPSADIQAESRAAPIAQAGQLLPLPLPLVAARDAPDTIAPTIDAEIQAASPMAPGFVAEAAPASTPPGEVSILEVRPGDSLDRLFRRHGLSVVDLAYLLKVKDAAPHLKRIRPGDRIEVRHEGESVLAMQRRLDLERTLVVERGEDGAWSTRHLDHPVETVVRTAQGRISSSFYAAGMNAGLSDPVIMRLAGIFAWDIDFALDIRRDDWFAVVFEEIWQDGRKVRDGDILAAEFGNQGRSYRALRFVDDDGRTDYFTPEGRSLRKAFLRAPVDFARVSSNFNPNRLHPILKVRRPHQGVDYAANQGTPIRAAGDGKVTFAGSRNGYGNAVILQHGGNITTLYAHMSRIASEARVGRRVRQGQVIGYVGKTGLATAPHLHYEYRINGVHRNPRTVPLPEAEPVPETMQSRFAADIAPLVAELDALAPTRLASAE